MRSLFPPVRAEIAPGAVHVPGWLTPLEQRELVDACRGWARGPAPMRHTELPNGGVMSVQSVSLGWHWLPYRYSRTADDVDGAGSPRSRTGSASSAGARSPRPTRTPRPAPPTGPTRR